MDYYEGNTSGDVFFLNLQILERQSNKIALTFFKKIIQQNLLHIQILLYICSRKKQR